MAKTKGCFMLLTEDQAYMAMVVYLKERKKRTGSNDPLGAILGDLDVHCVFKDDLPNDPASWDDWLEAVELVKQAISEGKDWKIMKTGLAAKIPSI